MASSRPGLFFDGGRAPLRSSSSRRSSDSADSAIAGCWIRLAISDVEAEERYVALLEAQNNGGVPPAGPSRFMCPNSMGSVSHVR